MICGVRHTWFYSIWEHSGAERGGQVIRKDVLLRGDKGSGCQKISSDWVAFVRRYHVSCCSLLGKRAEVQFASRCVEAACVELMFPVSECVGGEEDCWCTRLCSFLISFSASLCCHPSPLLMTDRQSLCSVFQTSYLRLNGIFSEYFSSWYGLMQCTYSQYAAELRGSCGNVHYR